MTVPGCASCSARLTAPTVRIVCVTVPSVVVGSPLTDIATSPIPNAYSIMNSPGCGVGNGSPTGSRHSVAESRFSVTRLRTRYGTGVIAEDGEGHVAASVIVRFRDMLFA
jgi:hypothetical protein